MKTMREWEVRGIVTLDVIVKVEAETLEEAIEIAEDDVSIEEYCRAQVGVDYGYADEVTDADLCNGGMGIEWHEEWCQQTGEFEVYDDEEERVLQCGLADDIDAGYCGREVTQIFITKNVVEVWVKERDV